MYSSKGYAHEDERAVYTTWKVRKGIKDSELYCWKETTAHLRRVFPVKRATKEAEIGYDRLRRS